MEDAFKIFVDQLRDGETEELSEELPPSFLDVNEKDLTFKEPVNLKGEAYLAQDSLVLHFNIDTVAQLPCVICNENVKVPIHIENSYHAIPLEEVKSGIYNMTDLLRENILLETPLFAECNEGNCLKRKDLKQYFKNPEANQGEEADEGYKPFADLEM